MKTYIDAEFEVQKNLAYIRPLPSTFGRTDVHLALTKNRGLGLREFIKHQSPRCIDIGMPVEQHWCVRMLWSRLDSCHVSFFITTSTGSGLQRDSQPAMRNADLPPHHFARHENRQLGSEISQRPRLPMSPSAQARHPNHVIQFSEAQRLPTLSFVRPHCILFLFCTFPRFPKLAISSVPSRVCSRFVTQSHSPTMYQSVVYLVKFFKNPAFVGAIL